MRRLLFAVLLAWLLPAAPALSAEPELDLRVLIDVSGSMKKNDPSNLRGPALRLLVGLLPDQARAGVWSFGEHINELVALGTVNEAWKKLGQQASRRIGSREMFTNIEQGLMRATSDWKQASEVTRRSVILLTDGLVDVDKDAALNVESRRRILEELLPKLREAGATLHTVALSGNADHELLQALAMATDGGYEYADSAERLNRVFVKLFEKSVPADSVPLRDNRFDIDASIQDMTLLVFNQPGAPDVGIVAPDGTKYTRGNPPPNVTWAHESGYDLVTVEGPAEGQWRLDADVDPDNRVMVVTNLKMKTELLPNNLLKDDRLQVAAWLEEDGKRVEKPDFLQLIRFEASEETEGRPIITSLLDDGAGADRNSGDGIYSADLGDLSRVGSYQFALSAEGGSFKREIRHTMQVHDSPVSVSLEPVSEDPAAGFALRIEARKELVDQNTIVAEFRLQGGGLSNPEIPQTGAAQWGLDIPATEDNRTAQIRVEGRLMNGRLFKVEIERLLPGFAATAAETPAEIPLPPAEPEEEIDWMQVGILVGGTNLVLIPLLVYGYMFWKKKRKAVVTAEQEALEL